jgi:hypothetical protein
VVVIYDSNGHDMAYVPPALINIIIPQFHQGLGNAHESKEKTMQKIRSLYFWPTMRPARTSSTS